MLDRTKWKMCQIGTVMLFLAFVTFHPAAECVLVQAQQLLPGASSSSPSRPSQRSTMNIAFDLPDLITTMETAEGTAQLVAYRSVDNDRILRNTTGGAVQQSQLFWVSIGLPKLIQTPPATGNRSHLRLFHFTHHGFTVYVEMLSAEQRRALADKAREKYGVGDLADSQVLNLLLSGFQCSLVMYDGAGNRYQVNGKVSDFSNYPLRLDFLASAKSAERRIFQELIADPEIDLQFDCRVNSSGKLVKVNTLTISANQQMVIGLEEQLFGPVDNNGPSEVYVNRNQMTKLTGDLHATLNIFEDYQMSENHFSQAFIDGLIDQSVASQFSYVSIGSALETLSKFGFDIGADIQPDIVERDAGSILKIETKDSKSRIILDEAKFDESQESDTDSGSKRRGGILGLLFPRSSSWSKSNARRSESGSRSVSDQLRELNTASQDEAQWEVEGTRVVPKSLNVARLTRSNLRKTLTFSRVRVRTSDAPFRKDFAVYTIRAAAASEPPIEEKLTARVTELQSATELLRTQMADVSSAVRRCRVCFNENEGGDNQCGGERHTCASWSDSISAKWTLPFKDDTDNRSGGCTYQWAVQCQG